MSEPTDYVSRTIDEVLALREENARLRAIVEGRTVPPTDEEIAAHEAAGGWWLVSDASGVVVALSGESVAHAVAHARDPSPGLALIVRWWALDASGNPCPWPTAPALPDADGGGR